MKKPIYLLWILMALSYLIPLGIMSFYNLPTDDDLARININVIEKLKGWFIHHNGRYINALLACLPFMYNYILYKFHFFIFLLFSLFGIQSLIKKVTGINDIRIRIFLSLFVHLQFFIAAPSIAQAYYWYGSLSAYTFSFTLFLILFGFLYDGHKNGVNSDIKKYTPFLLVFLIVGSHEISMGATCITVFLFLILNIKSAARWYYLTLNSVAALCSLAVIILPGSINRRSTMDQGGNLTESLINSIQYTFIYVSEHLFSNYYLILFNLFWMILCLVFWRNNPHRNININPLIFTLYSFFLVALSIFIVYYSGVNENNLRRIFHSRIGNILLMYYQFLVAINILFYSKIVSKLLPKKSIAILIPILLPLIFFTSFLSNNSQNLIKEIWNGEMLVFHEEWYLRKEYVSLFDQERLIRVPPFTYNPSTLRFADISQDLNHWRNKAYCHAFCSSNTIQLDPKVSMDYLRKFIKFKQKENSKQ